MPGKICLDNAIKSAACDEIIPVLAGWYESNRKPRTKIQSLELIKMQQSVNPTQADKPVHLELTYAELQAIQSALNKQPNEDALLPDAETNLLSATRNLGLMTNAGPDKPIQGNLTAKDAKNLCVLLTIGLTGSDPTDKIWNQLFA